MKTPLVVDCFQGEDIRDWTQVYAAGIRGVIHKASEGSNFRDKTYLMRRDRARKAGLLWGAYHFLNDTDVEAQARNFLEAAQPDVDTLLALDYEENKHRTGSLEQARRFLEIIFAKTGQRPVIYSGNLLKEQLRAPDAFFNQHRLWVAHYADKPTLPRGWFGYWLHQYTGDGVGPGPHEVPGILTKGIDLNVFGGDDLAAEWAPRGPLKMPVDNKLSEPDKKLLEPIAMTVKGAWGSRTVNSLGLFLATITGGVKAAVDAVLSLVPDAVDTVSANLSMAQKVAGWFHVNWSAIETTMAVVFIVCAFAFLLHDKAEKARREVA